MDPASSARSTGSIQAQLGTNQTIIPLWCSWISRSAVKEFIDTERSPARFRSRGLFSFAAVHFWCGRGVAGRWPLAASCSLCTCSLFFVFAMFAQIPDAHCALMKWPAS